MNAEMHLPIYKQGDDLHHCLGVTKDNYEALMLYSATLEEAAKQCREVAEAIKDKEVTFDACTHWIGVDGPDDLIQLLIDRELLNEDPFADEEDEEEFDDETDDDFDEDEDE